MTHTFVHPAVSSLCMKELTEALREVVDWHQLGVLLGIKPFRLQEVRMNHPHDAHHCKVAMLDGWLRSDVEASWEKLAQALEKMDQAPVAMAIRDKYGRDVASPGEREDLRLCLGSVLFLCQSQAKRCITVVSKPTPACREEG